MKKYSDYYPAFGIIIFIICFFFFSDFYTKELYSEDYFLPFFLLIILPCFVLTVYFSLKHNGKFYYLHSQNRGYGPKIDSLIFLFLAYFIYYILMLIAFYLLVVLSARYLNPQTQIFVLLLFNPIFIFLLMIFIVNRVFSKSKEEKL